MFMLNMKNISLGILQLIFPVILLAGNAQQDLVSQGDSAYNAKEYLAATEKYELVLDQGFESAELYYNLGNAYLQIGDLGRAILNYRRAEALIGSDGQLERNLAYARSLCREFLSSTAH